MPEPYDEFGFFADNAAEAGIEWHGPPTVARVTHALEDGRTMSALRWGTEPVEVVFVHGGGQNAHTWDTVALALGRPALMIDLAGHGHSDEPSATRPIGPRSFALDLAEVVAALAPDAALVVGMSLGGMSAMQLAVVAPRLVRALMMVDVTPGTDKAKAAEITAFLAGPESFASFDEILERTVLFNPTRSESSLRRGILHNAVERDDGTWVWRHQRADRSALSADTELAQVSFASLWDDLGSISVPMWLVRGDRSPVVDDADEAEFRRRQPEAEVVLVADAGHSIQGDQPLELARLVGRALDG